MEVPDERILFQGMCHLLHWARVGITAQTWTSNDLNVGIFLYYMKIYVNICKVLTHANKCFPFLSLHPHEHVIQCDRSSIVITRVGQSTHFVTQTEHLKQNAA